MLSTRDIVLIAYGSYLLLLSIITYFAYRADKKKSQERTIPHQRENIITSLFLRWRFWGLSCDAYLSSQNQR